MVTKLDPTALAFALKTYNCSLMDLLEKACEAIELEEMGTLPPFAV